MENRVQYHRTIVEGTLYQVGQPCPRAVSCTFSESSPRRSLYFTAARVMLAVRRGIGALYNVERCNASRD